MQAYSCYIPISFHASYLKNPHINSALILTTSPDRTALISKGTPHRSALFRPVGHLLPLTREKERQNHTNHQGED